MALGRGPRLGRRRDGEPADCCPCPRGQPLPRSGSLRFTGVRVEGGALGALDPARTGVGVHESPRGNRRVISPGCEHGCFPDIRLKRCSRVFSIGSRLDTMTRAFGRWFSGGSGEEAFKSQPNLLPNRN